MNDDMVDQLADILIDDHVNVLLENNKLREQVEVMRKENARLRDMVARARYHLYLLADDDDDELLGLVKQMTWVLGEDK